MESNFRNRLPVTKKENNLIFLNNKQHLDFSSNDYLGLSTDTRVKKALAEGAWRYGLGSGGSALVSGYHLTHKALEENFAEFMNQPKALLFNSGYQANLGIFNILSGKNSLIVSDKLCHASILAGIKLSHAKHSRFNNNDAAQAENILKRQIYDDALLVTEGVFSMEGKITPLPALTVLASQYKAKLIVDEAHSIGILGENGRGVCEHYNFPSQNITCTIAPLGKAFGSMGAVVLGNEDIIEALVQCAASYRYTTALPPALSFATLESLKILQKESWRRSELWSLISFFNKEAQARNLPLLCDDITPIKCFLVGDNLRALRFQKALLNQGFLVACIRPPTVPERTARLRISLNCFHREKDILHLLDILSELYELPEIA